MKQTLAKQLLAIVCALMFICLAGCTSTPPQEGSNLPQPTTSEPSAMSETPARSDIRDDALAASPVAYPKPFDPGYFTALNAPVVVAEWMGVTFFADESAEFTTPYDCNIDRCVLAENTGELSVLIAWKVSSQAQGLSPDDIMTHPQPQMLVLDPGKSTVIRPCWQYSPVDIALSDATFNVEIDVIERNTMQRETVRFDLHNNVTVTEHSKPLPGNATVSGKIISADTGEPLCNVPIEISDANFRYILSTDNNGEYEASVFAYKNARGYYLEYAMLVNAEASNAQIHMQQGNNNDFASFGQVMEYDSPLDGMSKKEIWTVQVSDDNKLLAYGDTAGMVWLMDMEADKILWSEFCGGQVRKLGFDKQDSVLYVSAGDGYLRCFSTSDGSLIWETYVDAWITKWTITDHYITAMTKASPCAVQVVDKHTGENVLSIPVTTGGSEVTMSPDESLIWYYNCFSGGKSSLSNNIYDINEKMLYSMIQPGMTAAFTADSELFAVQDPKTIAVVNREGQILWQYDFALDINHPNSWACATTLWISGDGKHIVSGANGDLSAANLGQIFFFSRD